MQPGLVLAVGPNGVGKTNLLESLHVATQGFSPRTRNDAQLIRFGERAARIAVRGTRGTVPLEIELTLEAGVGQAREAERRAAARGRAAAQRDGDARLHTGPARRRQGRARGAARVLRPRRSAGSHLRARTCRRSTARAVAQRNASLRRVAGGYSSRDALDAVDGAGRGARDASSSLRGRRRSRCSARRSRSAPASSGLADAELRYDGAAVTVAELDARLDRDLERGVTGIGPHLDDVVLAAGGRELRSFGSQGEQRLAVLALLLAEAELIADRRGFPPLLLLDDVLSELDPERRRILAARVTRVGQALITATDAAMLPVGARPAARGRPRGGARSRAGVSSSRSAAS